MKAPVSKTGMSFCGIAGSNPALSATQRPNEEVGDMTTKASRIGLGGLSEVHLKVRDLEAMRRFYVETLGFEEEFNDEGQMVGVKTGGADLALVASETSTQGAAMAFDCMDVNATVEELRAIGITITEEPWDGHWGGRVAAFEDPEGNTVYLEQPA